MGAVTAGAGAGAPAPRGGCAHLFFALARGGGRAPVGHKVHNRKGPRRAPWAVEGQEGCSPGTPQRTIVHAAPVQASIASGPPRPPRLVRRGRACRRWGRGRTRAATDASAAVTAAASVATVLRVQPHPTVRPTAAARAASSPPPPPTLPPAAVVSCRAVTAGGVPAVKFRPHAWTFPSVSVSTGSFSAARPLPLSRQSPIHRRSHPCARPHPPTPPAVPPNRFPCLVGGDGAAAAAGGARLSLAAPRGGRGGDLSVDRRGGVPRLQPPRPPPSTVGGPPRRPVLWARRRGTRHETDDHLEIWALHGLRWHARRGRPPRTAAATATADWVTFVQPPRWGSPTTEDRVAGVDPQVAPSAARRGLRGRPVSRESRAAGPPRLPRQTRPRPLEPIHCGRRCAAGARPASWLRRPPGADDPAVHRQGVHPCKERRARGRGEKGPPRWGRRPRRRPRLAAGGPSGDQRHALPPYPCMGGPDGTFRGRVRRGRGRGTDPPRPVHCNRASGGEWEDAGGSGLYERLLLKRRMG